MEFNWVDWTILAVIIYYLVSGWETGFVFLVANLFSFFGSLLLALRFHAPVGTFLAEKFGIPAVWTTVLGYIVVALVTEAILSEIVHWFISKLPKKYMISRVNQWLGAAVSAGNGIIIVTFFLLVILALPIRGTIKKDVNDSRIGKVLVKYAERYTGQVKSLLTFITIEPLSKERINLEIEPKESELTVDEVSEQRMIELVNSERSKSGISMLVVDSRITQVARSHSRDMFLRRYFSHINSEGQDAGDRLKKAGISYMLAAENLAYTPDVVSAHEGLMQSEGHKRNILDPKLKHIGIGVIDAGIYGKMFTQNFTD